LDCASHRSPALSSRH